MLMKGPGIEDAKSFIVMKTLLICSSFHPSAAAGKRGITSKADAAAGVGWGGHY